MKRSLLIHSALFVLGLALSYALWQRDPARATNEVVPLLHLRKITEVDYRSAEREARLRYKKAEPNPRVWITHRAKVPGQAPVAKTPTEKGASKKSSLSAPDRWRAREFLGNEKALARLDGLHSLSALRALGSISQAKAQSLGLASSKATPSPATMIIHGDRTKFSFAIGRQTFGKRDYYIQNLADGQVYLIDKAIIADLDRADLRLFERAFNPSFALEDVTRLVLEAGDKKAEFRSEMRSKGRQRVQHWSVMPSSAHPSATLASDEPTRWIKQIRKITVAGYLDSKAKVPALDKVFTVRYYGRSSRDELGFLHVFSETLLIPQTVGTSPQGAVAYLARSNNSSATARVSKSAVDRVLAFFPKLFRNRTVNTKP